MKPKDLKPGHAYFACAYFSNDKPVPEIETWIYIGANISQEDATSGEVHHYFQDPESYFFDEMLSGLTPEQAREYERPESPVHMRVLDDDVEGFVQNLEELETFVSGLAREPNADQTF